MSFYVTTKKSDWNKALKELSCFKGSAYYTYDYLKACEAAQQGKAFAAILFYKTNILFYPFILKSNKFAASLGMSDFSDIESPYGYGGVVWKNNQNLINAFNCFFYHFKQWCKENKVIAEFVRFNPFINNSSELSKYYDEISLNRKTVLMPLHKDLGNILNSVTAAKRRNFKKAVNNNLKFYITSDFTHFKKLYTMTMVRNKASEFYFFNEEYFNVLKRLQKCKQLYIAEVFANDDVVASAIFLKDLNSGLIHYHLGGSDKTFKEFYPNVFLIISMAFYSSNILQSNYMHLGGGLSVCENDTLFKFKKGFSKQFFNFYIGKKIHNTEKYKFLSAKWLERTGNNGITKLLFYYN